MAHQLLKSTMEKSNAGRKDRELLGEGTAVRYPGSGKCLGETTQDKGPEACCTWLRVSTGQPRGRR